MTLTNINILIKREQLAMGDTGPYSITREITNKTSLHEIINLCPYNNKYPYILIGFYNNNSYNEIYFKKDNDICITDQLFSDFITQYNLDINSEITIKLNKQA